MAAAAVIIAVYERAPALELVLRALAGQTCSDFEVIVADDGSGPAVGEVVARVGRDHPRPIAHVRHDRAGWRKTAILNEAVRRAGAPYLVFLDGDCVPRADWLRQHARHRGADTVLCGNRVWLGRRLSQSLETNTARGEASRLPSALALWRDSLSVRPGRTRHADEAVFVAPSWLQRAVRRRPRLLGCNFSLPRALLERVNGFDESYPGPGFGEDTDVEYRLRLSGARFVSVRNRAIVYHLDHPQGHADPAAVARYQEVCREGPVVCRRGLRDLGEDR
jgi:GT2 family glycosyltransferase